MKIEVRFLAETPEDVQKLNVTLAAFQNGIAVMSADTGGVNEAAPTKTRKTKAEKAAAAQTAPPVEEFNFDDFIVDPPQEEDETVIDLEAIRALVNAKAAAGHGAMIRNIMGSFAIAALSALTPAQYKAFHKSISAL